MQRFNDSISALTVVIMMSLMSFLQVYIISSFLSLTVVVKWNIGWFHGTFSKVYAKLFRKKYNCEVLYEDDDRCDHALSLSKYLTSVDSADSCELLSWCLLDRDVGS
jgi:hypothetical protein